MTRWASSQTSGGVSRRTNSSSMCSAGRLSNSRRHLPEQDRDNVQLQLVELPRPQQRLRRPGPLHHRVARSGRRAGLRGALAHIGDIADAARRRVVRDVVGQDEDRYAVVVVALPAASMLVGTAAGKDGVGGQQLVEHRCPAAR